MIGLILSSVAVATLYLAFSIVYKKFHLYAQASAVTRDYLSLEHALSKDVENAFYITDSLDNFLVMHAGNGSITYQFSDQGVIRASEQGIDRFKLQVEDFRFIQSNITLQLRVNDHSLIISLDKDYSAEQLMKYE